jgi:addiction module RelB/DinJ family antitoxin
MTSTIIIRTDSKLKAKAQKTAAELGLTLSTVINNQLKKFVEEKSFYVSGNSKSVINKPPYGIFKGEEITEEEIKEVTSSLDKKVDELIKTLL